MTRLVRFLLALAAAVVLSGCSKGEVYAWRMRYEATVETAEGPKVGASVLEEKLLDRRKNPQFGSGNIVDFALRGEAVVVDLGQTGAGPRHLFALVVRNEFAGLAVAARALGLPSDEYAEIARRIGEVRGISTLPPAEYPLLVTFADIADPKSVRRVDPDDLDAAFGLCPDGKGLKDEDAPWRAEGLTWRRFARWQASGLSLQAYKDKYEYSPRPKWLAALDAKVTPRDRSADCRRLKAITLEIVEEAVTEGKVEAVLGWFNDKQLFERIWPELTRDERSLLSSVNWKKD